MRHPHETISLFYEINDEVWLEDDESCQEKAEEEEEEKCLMYGFDSLGRSLWD